MPRVNRVKKCQKDQGSCGKCFDKIPKGSPYLWWKFRYGGKRKRCAKPGCAPRGSDLTSSHHLSALYAAQESIGDAQGGSQDDIAAALNGAAEQAREVGEEYRESAQNIEDGFGHRTYQCDEIEEKADACDAWADALETAASEVEQMEAEPETCSTCGGSGEETTDCESCEDGQCDGEECVECGGAGELELPCGDCDGDGETENEDGQPDQEAMDDCASQASDELEL